MNSPTSSDPGAPPGSIATNDHEAAVIIDNLSVRYRLPNINTNSLKEFAIKAVTGQIKYDYLWALKDVSLTIRKGEILGLIGHNGAGKSTLLKVVARVLKPTEGRARVHGHVAPLLGIGAAFHIELTGRENVFLNGSLLGFSRKDMEEKFERIVDFAELWDYIDQPLRIYSSGMRARLGFAVATDAQPDILIVDEVLAVGDEAFRSKCEDRMRAFRDAGATIILVTHSMETILGICHRAAWIHQGRVRMMGETKEVVNSYIEERREHRSKQNPRLRA
ncbi:MAG TPA: ABC transporter ATP-binding protein [Anaerolineales bacterium]|nr:ABC transporter ATP-binding protein [Anaerolineales bacterium]